MTAEGWPRIDIRRVPPCASGALLACFRGDGPEVTAEPFEQLPGFEQFGDESDERLAWQGVGLTVAEHAVER